MSFLSALSWRISIDWFSVGPLFELACIISRKTSQLVCKCVENTERSCWSHARNYCKIAAKSTVLYSRWKGFLFADNWPNKIIAATNQSMDANLKAIDAVNTQFAVFFTRLSIGTTSYVNLYQVKGCLVTCWWSQLSLMTIYYIKEERWSRAKRNITYPQQIVLACL